MPTSTRLNPARRSGGRTARFPPTRPAPSATARSTSCRRTRSSCRTTRRRWPCAMATTTSSATAPTTSTASTRRRSAIPRASPDVLTPGGYPAVTMNGYSNIGHGAHNITLFEGHTVNATMTKFKGKHSFKVGVDYRRLSGYSEAPNNGNFALHPGLHAGAEREHGEQRRRRRVREFPARLSRHRRRERRDARQVLHRLLLGVRAGRLPASRRS